MIISEQTKGSELTPHRNLEMSKGHYETYLSQHLKGI